MINPYDYVGKIIGVSDGRFIRIEAFLDGDLEIFFLVRWLDTNEVFCEYPDKILELLRSDKC